MLYVAEKATMDKIQSKGRKAAASLLVSWKNVLVTLVSLGFLLPASLVLLPFTFLNAKKQQGFTSFPPVTPSLVKGLKPAKEREFDLVVFGATGFAGKLALQYLATTYKDKSKLKFAIAGRNRKVLEKLKAEVGFPELGIIEADSMNEQQLHELCARTKVVATTVGPYLRYGTLLVTSCIANGTHYVDITGEFGWVNELVTHYHTSARDKQVIICNFCGHDSVPWDMLTFKLNAMLPSGEKLAKIQMFDLLLGKPSGYCDYLMLR